MADILSRRRRSALMAKIKGKGNAATELKLIALFRRHGITGWRRGSRLPGRPDFVFPAARLAVFVDGCFWHGCPRHATWPKQNAAFWRAKILRNRARDREVGRELRALGWSVLRIWQHALAKRGEARTVARVWDKTGGRKPETGGSEKLQRGKVGKMKREAGKAKGGRRKAELGKPECQNRKAES